MSKKILFIVIFSVFSVVGFTQEYNYFHYDIKDGLSGINVYKIVQDKDGFLWFATETGLSRFDGTKFRNFTSADGLHDNEIISLFVDSKNRVWIIPFNKAIYYYYEGKIHNAKNDSLVRKFNLKSEIYQACEDKYGNIFFLESSKVHILNNKDEMNEVTDLGEENFFGGINIYPDGVCNVFVSSLIDEGYRIMHRYEYQASQFKLKSIMLNHVFARNSVVSCANYIVLRNSQYFYIHNEKSNEDIQEKIPDYYHTLSYINDSLFAISTSAKTYFFNVNEKKIVDSFLTSKLVNQCFQDNEGNIWFATSTQGAYRLSYKKIKLYSIDNNSTSVSVHSLGVFNNELLIGSNENILWSLNLSSGKIQKNDLDTGLHFKRISSIQQYNLNNLFIATDNGLMRINPAHKDDYFPSAVIKSMFFHNDSLLFTSDRFTLDFSLKTYSINCDTILAGRGICAVDLNNKCYVGTLGGLYIVQKDAVHTTIFMGNKYPFLKNKIIALSIDKQNRVWAAVENYGLVCLQNNSVIYTISIKNGLVSNACRCIYIDNNFLWLGTSNGISKINLTHYPFEIKNYTALDGLDCEIINCLYSKGDSVFAGTPFGLTFFKADNIYSRSICNLKIMDIQSAENDWYNKPNNINLKADDAYLNFEYAGISFLSAGDITYYYQLKGLDTAWQTTKENSVRFERLPAGYYTFNIYAINRYGVRSKTISISFIKEKHFWELWWVQALAVLLVIVLIWLILRTRIKTIRKSANEKVLQERKIHELEQMALRAQMNPHFIFNSLNSIQQYIFSGNVVEANEFITTFSSLIRQTLYLSGKKFITIEEEIKYLQSYLAIEQSKYENIFDFTIKTNNINLAEETPVPPLILQPYIENSIRHGVLNLKERRGKIDIYFLLEDDQLICTVRDNGIGREESSKLKQKTRREHKSKGMELVQKRIESLNSIYHIFINVSVEDVIKPDEKGTVVTIKFPLSYAE